MSSEKLKVFLATFVLTAAVGATNVAQAEPLEISDAPLFVAVSVGPNIMFTFDDSGSMQWEAMPDDITFWSHMYPRPNNLYGPVNYSQRIPWFGDNQAWNLRLRSFDVDGSPRENALAYNPHRQYKPWVKSDGSLFDPADPEDALYNPASPGLGGMDLTERTWHYYWWDNGNRNDWRQFWPITFYMYKGSGSVNSPNSYVKYQFHGSNAYKADPADSSLTPVSGFDWPNGPSRTVSEERQNFANWFTFYRSRALVARAGIGRAFSTLPSNARVGFGAINKGSTQVDGVSTRTVIDGVRSFSGEDRETFYERLYDRHLTGSTPMRRAAEGVGEYFERTDSRGPWSTTPGSSDGKNLECRQSFHILMTDGFWNGGDPGVGNADGSGATSYTGPDGQSGGYTPSDPFRDNLPNTLGDVAMYYWKRDLQGDLENRVPVNEADPAFWQHLTSFGVGLGVTGDLDPEDVQQAVLQGDAVDWGNPYSSDSSKIDDLLHFGINGRGGFFSAADPDEFAEKLSGILSEIVARANSTTSVAVSSTRLDAGAFVYRALFDSEDWSGELIAEDVYEETVIFANDELADKGTSNRDIYTFVPDNDEQGDPDQIGDGSAVAFDTGAAGDIGERLAIDDDADSDLWNAENLISYIRGNDSLEGPDGFRERSVMLGDIINSRPVASTAGNEGWGRVDDDYLDYIAGHKNDPRDCPETGSCDYARRDTVFVGANDGMLHAFDARNLEEYFAYVPASVHGNLKHLADRNYSHKYFVDGQIAVGDANFEGDWGTYLVGTLGAGGKGVYALDVTDPEEFDEDDVMWELTAEDDPDIGYTYGEPVITRLNDDAGTWVAIFGNGYNSQDLQAHLFVVKLSNGEILQKIPVGDAGSNGLSGVAALRDVNEQTHVDRIYAGDLEGTMWRFDFEDGTASVKYDSGLYSSGRPIVSRPALTLDPSGGVLVYFGTGKLIEKADKTDQSLERFYGIRDRGASVEWGDLASSESGGGVGGWYISLDSSGQNGEKTFGPPRIGFGGYVTFATFEPVNDACTPGGSQRLYLRDSLTGAGGGPSVIGSGAPISPPITIRPPGGPGAPITFPGKPEDDDDDDDDDDPDFPEPPDLTDGTPDEWCSVIEIPPLVDNGDWTRLGSICEGRQIWREVR